MASSSPPILPITNLPTTTTTGAAGGVQSQPPIDTPAFRAFITHITETVRNGLSQRRPWSELVDRSAFSKPESFSEATLRIRKNYSYFRVNYMSLLAVVLAVSLLTNPFSLLLLLGLLAAWLFLYLFRPSDPPLVIFGRTFSERETLGILIVSSVVVIFLTRVGSVLISALMIGLAVVCAHGAFRVPEDLFLDEQEPAATGFLSFLGGAASNAAGSARATSEIATTSNVTDPVETTLKEKEDPRITGRRGRSKSKDVAASMEARLERMERAVADIGMQLEDEIPSSAILEAAVEDLRGKALGALNSMADTLRQEFQRQLDQVFAELASFQNNSHSRSS
ncbi:hypothetical protein F0562_017762 [Nyssa sinensis]|uniref:PRA1 family protein n=1 Tax=Nyssa sinensis TaxID=561372 RepID=A0A5J4ZHC0_9ASTE|nr:hypothetical protein F0562_017762 [Nyssa sinensis]